MKIRRATQADLNALIEVGRTTYAEHFRHIWAPAGLDAFLDREFAPQSVTRELASDGVAYFIAESQPDGMAASAALGFAKLRYPRAVPTDDSASGVELQKIYLRKAAVGSGTGARLLEACIQHAEQLGFALVWLDVLERNGAAKRFYERYGFVCRGNESFATDLGEENMLVMQKSLRGRSKPMSVNKPEEMAGVWADAYNRGDLDALVGLYEPDGAFAARKGPLYSRAAIRSHFARVLSTQTQIQHRTRKLVDQGEIALCYGEWTLFSRADDGTPTTRTGSSVEVLRRQPDGTWLYLIDDPDTGS